MNSLFKLNFNAQIVIQGFKNQAVECVSKFGSKVLDGFNVLAFAIGSEFKEY